MSQQECTQLDHLLKVANEAGSPLSDWEKDFVKSLDKKRKYELSEKQSEVFDRLVSRHVT